MAILRRLLLILLGLALVALLTVLLLVPQTIQQLGEALQRLPAALRAAVAAAADLAILAIIYTLVRPARRPDQSGLVVQSSGAIADVGVESARNRILKAVRAVPNVATVDATLQAIQGRADIELEVGVAGDNVNVPSKQKEIDRALRHVTQKQLGLRLAARPRVHIHLLSDAGTSEDPAPPPLARPAAAQPPVVSPAPAAPNTVKPASGPSEQDVESHVPRAALVPWLPERKPRKLGGPLIGVVEPDAQEEAPGVPPLDDVMLSDIDPDHANPAGPASTQSRQPGLYGKDTEAGVENGNSPAASGEHSDSGESRTG